MLCPRCGYYAEKEDTVCPECGEILNIGADLPTEGAEAIRQGKRARQAIREAAFTQAAENRRRRRSGASHATVELPAVRDDRDEGDISSYTVSEKESESGESREGSVFERRRRQIYDENDALEEQAKAYTEWIGKGSRKPPAMVNWMKVSLIAFAAIVLVAVGIWLFLEKTGEGQKLMARMGRKASSSALWSVGEELMDTGDMDGAIRNFAKAKEQDEKANHEDVDGLLMLASAYEAAGRTDEAAELYERIYTNTPSRTEAYVNHIRILLASTKEGDQAKAGELMKLAYEMTGESSFQTQRRDFLPAPPEVDLTAGFYEAKKYITISSYQGYEVWYTFQEDAKLPDDGVLWTDKVFLDEGTWNLRAVAKNGELISDELKATYKIIMPSPQMPQCNLAPGAYKTRQKIRLRPGQENKNDDDIQIYYTVDGSIPDADSPIYNGDPIQLPSGHTVTIKATAVNKYGKQSKMLEVSFKIDAKPYPQTAWDSTETIANLELNKTTLAEFQSLYGEGKQAEVEQTGIYGSDCRKYEYSWGYIVTNLVNKKWVLVELCCRDSTFKAPRGTGVGDPMDFVVGKFKDLGQVESPSGNRGLYQLENGNDGKILLQEDKQSRILRYRIRNEEHWYLLEYHVNAGGTVTEVDWWYKP